MKVAAKPQAIKENGNFRVFIKDHVWELAQAGDLEERWAAMTGILDDDQIPYWTELWPASLGLGDWLISQSCQIAGKVCLDIGCGLGLTAIAGQMAGGRTLTMDLSAEAVAHCRRNALRNGVPSPCCMVMDWRHPALRPRSLDLIWGADILYESRFIKPVLDLLATALKPDGKAWIADPGRNIFERFAIDIKSYPLEMTLAEACEVPTIEKPDLRASINIWEISAGGTLDRHKK